MTTELSKIQMCVLLRNGMQIWVEKEKADKLQNILQGIDNSKFIKYENITINTADITGVFEAKDLDNYTKIKKGQWQCKKGYWHSKEEECTGHRQTKWNKEKGFYEY